MDDTKQFIDKLHDKQQKDEQNRKRQGKGHPEKNYQINNIKQIRAMQGLHSTNPVSILKHFLYRTR